MSCFYLLLSGTVFILLEQFPYQPNLLFTHSWRENRLIYAFPKSVGMKWNAESFVQDLNLAV